MSIADSIIALASRRSPDLQIGGSDNPYLNRWYLIPRNRLLNIYLHQFIRDDEDRALHDHPWVSISWLMRGMLIEVTELWIGTLRGHGNRVIFEGALRYRSSIFAHRLVVPDGYRGDTWTLFITGPRIREWGFRCPQGWRHWRDFTAGANGETIGRGCAES